MKDNYTQDYKETHLFNFDKREFEYFLMKRSLSL